MLTWKLEGDEIWGYANLGDPFTAYSVKEKTDRLYEAWSQRGESPRLLGTFGGPQAAMRACGEDFETEGA